MKKPLLFFFLFFTNFIATSQTNIEWSNTYGGPSSETVNDLTIAHDSDYVLVGCLTTNNAANAGIMKLQDHGNILWQKSYGSLGDDQFLCVANTNDSGYLAAGYVHASRLFEFAFNNILLVDSNMNEPLSHGYIHYRIKPLNNLIIGDSIKNKAAIYFDFNAPVITNTALTEVIMFVSVEEPSAGPGLFLYPNPATNEVNVYFESEIHKDLKYCILNSLGQKISEGNLNPDASIHSFKINTETLSPGLYILNFNTTDLSISRKIIKL